MPTPQEIPLQTPLSSPPEGVWDYTVKAADVVEARRARERQAGRESRPTITRDSRIDGGVYEGSYGGEAIVVDSNKMPAIQAALDDIMRRISPDGTPNKHLALQTVFNYVSTQMQYGRADVEEILQRAGGRDGTKIGLSVYIERGVGVCRHQALFAGVLLEKLADSGVLSGAVSVERNMNRRGTNDDKYDGHSWVRYTNSGGRVFILDVAQQQVAALSDLMTARRRKEKVWDYARPEDYAKLHGEQTAAAIKQASQWGREAGHSMVELDKDGLIIVPDWFKN